MCDAGEGCMSTWVHIYTVCLRLHLYVSVSDVQNSECVLYALPREIGLLPKLDSVIGSSENPKEAMSITAAARLPRGPQHSQQAGPSPACSDQMKSETGWDLGSKKKKRRVNFKPF